MAEHTDNFVKKNLKKILVVLMIIVLIIIGITIAIRVIEKPYDKSDISYKKITVEESYSVSDIGDVLAKHGIISQSDKFVMLTKLFVHGDKFKAGTFYLSPSMSYDEIFDTLINGVSSNKGFSIPSGYTVKQISESLEQAGYVKKKDFLKTAASLDLFEFDYIDNNINGYKKLEGFLLPGDYQISNEASSAMIIISMLNEFDNSFTEEYKARADELGMSIKDVVIMASIIENATNVDKDRLIISSVIHNKINYGMKFDKPYPDKPLCCPSIESIKAALFPEDTDYIFYIPSDKLDGSYNYATTIEEYNNYTKLYKDAKLKAREQEKDNQ